MKENNIYKNFTILLIDEKDLETLKPERLRNVSNIPNHFTFLIYYNIIRGYLLTSRGLVITNVVRKTRYYSTVYLIIERYIYLHEFPGINSSQNFPRISFQTLNRI